VHRASLLVDRLLSADEVEAYLPTPSVMRVREERRQELLESVMHIVLLEVEEMEEAQGSP